MKGCIFHLVKWQIHSFIFKGTRCHFIREGHIFHHLKIEIVPLNCHVKQGKARGFVNLKKRSGTNQKWVGGSGPKSYFFFKMSCFFGVVFMFLNVSKKINKLD